MPIAPDYFTADMARAMPDDGKRYEVVWGQLFVSDAPAPRHQRVVRRLDQAIGPYVGRHLLGEVFAVAGDISWGDDNLVQPDVFVVAPGHGEFSSWKEVRDLRLVIEVLSPTSIERDRFAKRKLYQDCGVETIWLVDPAQRLVEVWTPGARFPVVEHERVTWQPDGATEPLVIEIADLLA
jgi:Uma2 family endonuclease